MISVSKRIISMVLCVVLCACMLGITADAALDINGKAYMVVKSGGTSLAYGTNVPPNLTLNASVEFRSGWSSTGTYYYYRWYVDDVLQNSSNTTTYTVKSSDLTKYIKCVVTVSGAYTGTLEMEFICKYSQNQPSRPTINSISGNTVVLNNVQSPHATPVIYVMRDTYTGEYTYQTDNRAFKNLVPGRKYEFAVQYGSTVYYAPSATSAYTTYNHQGTETCIPDAPTAKSISATGLTLNKQAASANGAAVEYSKDGVNWQSSAAFTGLTSGTAYTFYARYGSTSAYKSSEKSAGTTIYVGDLSDVAAASITGSVSGSASPRKIGETLTVNVTPKFEGVDLGTLYYSWSTSAGVTGVSDKSITVLESYAETYLTCTVTSSLYSSGSGGLFPKTLVEKAVPKFSELCHAEIMTADSNNAEELDPDENVCAVVVFNSDVDDDVISAMDYTFTWTVDGRTLHQSSDPYWKIPNTKEVVGKTLTLTVTSTTIDGSVSTTAVINKMKQNTPDGAVIKYAYWDSVELQPVESPYGTTVLYRCGDGLWQESPVFEDLETSRAYLFYVKYAENEYYYESAQSLGVTGIPTCEKAENCPSTGFTDVSKSAWFHHAVDYVKENGIMSGKSASKFVPNANLTRAEIVQVLYNMAGKPEVTIENPFKDLKESHWYYNAVLWAVENNIASGTSSTTFGATGLATREQVVLMLRKYVALKGGDVSGSAELTSFTDAGKVSSWALEAVKWGVAEGVISGTTATTISPKGNTTRAQFAQMIFNYFGK